MDFKKEKKVHEGLGLDPITDYNKSKMICEKSNSVLFR